MIKKLFPILLALIGTGAGVGAGFFLLPSSDGHEAAESQVECLPSEHKVSAGDTAPERGVTEGTREYVKLNNQFVIPVMGATRVEALVVASLSVEVGLGSTENVYAREPKLRDAFLQVMFDHANIGGFEGSFTSAERMEVLRAALYDVAYAILGDDVSDVLITEIARQDT